MKRAYGWMAAVSAAAIVGGLGYATVAGQVGAARADGAPAVTLPVMADNFRLTDQNLFSHELYRMRDAKAVVLITQMDGCPINRNIAGAVKKLQAAYKDKGVEFMMLNSSPVDTREDILQEAKEWGYDMPVLLDRQQLVGEQLGVTRTAEVIVLDPKTWKIMYRGPVDDRVTYERQKAAAEHTWAADALDAVIAGKTPAVTSQPAEGCLIDFPHRADPKAAQITYVKDIQPIIEAKCVECHQPKGIGPMPLTSYEKIKAFAPMIREVLRTQRMPPWRADPTIGHFQGDKSLSSDQIKTLVHWVEAGAPRGEGVDQLASEKHVASDWPLGKPDLILDIPAYTIPASGIVDYQRPWVANPETEDKWVRASTIKVDQRQAVHHILTGYMTDVPKPGEEAFETKWGASVGGYAVGAESEVDPKDVGTLMPAGGAIGFQNHYTPFGKEVTAHSQIGLYFYKEQPKLMMRSSVIADPNISIPPGEEAWAQHAYLKFPHDALLYGAFPHAHYRGASSKLVMRTPDGKETLLLALPHYDFNWQRDYVFAEPIKIPAGSMLIAYYTYDNSTRNPANPDPKRTVPWGDQSMDEMLYTALRYRWVDETSAHPQVAYEDELKTNRLMGILDQRLDGKITKDELSGQMGTGIKANFDRIDANHDGVIDEKELAIVSKMMRRRERQADQKTADAAKPAATTPSTTGGSR